PLVRVRAAADAVGVFAALALNEHGAGSQRQDLAHPEQAGPDHVPDGGDEGPAALFLLVPPAQESAVPGTDGDLIDRRVQLDPWVAPGEGARVLRKRLGKLRVL